jgi:hypothetical protein
MAVENSNAVTLRANQRAMCRPRNPRPPVTRQTSLVGGAGFSRENLTSFDIFRCCDLLGTA